MEKILAEAISIKEAIGSNSTFVDSMAQSGNLSGSGVG